MIIPERWLKRSGNYRRAWGYSFHLTDDHLTEDEMYPMKFSYDTLGEEAYTILNDLSQLQLKGISGSGVSSKEPGGKSTDSNRDLYILLRDNADANETLSKLWNEVKRVPPWVDWAQIARGQDVFYRYGGPILTGLAFQSLLGGMGAARVVETLARTGGFSAKVARHRLFETTQHILQCTQSLASIQPGGAGFQSSIRVRLLHAAVRQRIMRLARERPEYYSVEKYGIPINDLDSIATIGTFSATLIWLSLPRQGIWMTRQEVVDYIALWRYIAYLVGSPTEPFETPEKAKKVMEVLLLYEIHPTETSKILAKNIITSLSAQPPSFASVEFLEVTSRFLNGNELSDALGLGRPGFYYWALSVGQALFFMFICYTYRSIPYLDRRKITALRKIFWKVIVENKHGLGGEESSFEFKYIPDLSKSTQIDDAPESGVKQPGVERRNLETLTIACIIVGVLAYFAWKILVVMGQRFLS
ncbi:hypothetical protein ACLMJK_005391 [Lecanora helva]